MFDTAILLEQAKDKAVEPGAVRRGRGAVLCERVAGLEVAILDVGHQPVRCHARLVANSTVR